MRQVIKLLKKFGTEIKHDIGVKICGFALIAACLAGLLIPDIEMGMPEALMGFIVGVYLAFRKESDKKESK